MDAPPSPQPLALASPADRVAIESASTYELASEALAQLQRILTDAHTEQQALDAELVSALQFFRCWTAYVAVFA